MNGRRDENHVRVGTRAARRVVVDGPGALQKLGVGVGGHDEDLVRVRGAEVLEDC